MRTGGTVSGPTLFTLADVAFYLLILSRIGPEALTVTTNATINFMRKPAPGIIFGDARILKQGKSLIVGDVIINNHINRSGRMLDGDSCRAVTWPR